MNFSPIRNYNIVTFPFHLSIMQLNVMALVAALPILRESAGISAVGTLLSLVGIANGVGKGLHGAFQGRFSPRTAYIGLLALTATASFAISQLGRSPCGPKLKGGCCDSDACVSPFRYQTPHRLFSRRWLRRLPGHRRLHLHAAPRRFRAVGGCVPPHPEPLRSRGPPSNARSARMRLPHGSGGGLFRLGGPPAGGIHMAGDLRSCWRDCRSGSRCHQLGLRLTREIHPVGR